VPDWVIEPMRASDLDEVLAIERVSFPTPWSRAAFLYELQQNPLSRCWVARGSGAPWPVLGYLCLWEIPPELHITNIAVRPDVRRRGIARALLGAILDDARGRRLTLAFLEVRPTNSEARHLYEALGFQVVGRRQGYYFDTGEDALLMRADLAPTASSPP
jgi:ribosomal-protein-alanine N-acetyltransferase